MKFKIKHEITGRIRIHMDQKKMTYQQADTLLYYLNDLPGVQEAKVYERTADAMIVYTGNRADLIKSLKVFTYDSVEVPDAVLANSGRELNAVYQEKLMMKVLMRAGSKLFIPAPVRAVITSVKSIKYLYAGARSLAKGKLEVSVLDATAIGVSVLRKNYDTAGSVMFLLGIGEILEEWTHKKSVGDLARSMSLNITKVWLKNEDQEVLVDATQIQPGDRVVVHMGNVIPFDGIVETGEGMVNQASMTGEAQSVRKADGGYVYAGTVLEEGELEIRVKETGSSTRFEKIVTMIEESEKLKSSVESKAERLADRLVPYTLAGTALTYLITRNATKAIAVLMVDFSCALKMAMPISVLSAIREAQTHHITVKGGKYLEAVAEADTIVFDKTGTLTEARPTVKAIVPFIDESKENLLRLAACLEEHFPHSIANAVVNKAIEKNLVHEELHSEVEYIVAHGIATTISNKRAVIGSYHFVMEDEHCTIPSGKEELFEKLPSEYSHLYLAIENKLAAVILIEDPLREEAASTIRHLKKAGIKKVVMMTGDSERTASAIAKKVGVDEYYSEVLPENKAEYVEKEISEGHTVIMIGDGINDSPALSKADVGIAMNQGASVAREIADITIDGQDLEQIVTLIKISKKLMKKVHKNYRTIVGFNSGLIILGVLGMIQPTTSALLHNASTLAIGLNSMKDVEED